MYHGAKRIPARASLASPGRLFGTVLGEGRVAMWGQTEARRTSPTGTQKSRLSFRLARLLASGTLPGILPHAFPAGNDRKGRGSPPSNRGGRTGSGAKVTPVRTIDATVTERQKADIAKIFRLPHDRYHHFKERCPTRRFAARTGNHSIHSVQRCRSNSNSRFRLTARPLHHHHPHR